MDANPNPSGRGDQSASVSAGLPEAERPELHQTQSRWLVGSRTRSRTPPHGRVVPRWPGGQTGSRSFIQGGSEASQTTVLDGREKRRAEKSREEKRREESGLDLTEMYTFTRELSPTSLRQECCYPPFLDPGCSRGMGQDRSEGRSQ